MLYCRLIFQRSRFSGLGWKNVQVLCIDALQFELPIEEIDNDVEVGLITMSYSCKFLLPVQIDFILVSMMQSPYPIVDKVKELLRYK